MKSLKSKVRHALLFLMAILGFMSLAIAYEINTHDAMSQEAASQSRNLLEQLPNYGYRTVNDSLDSGASSKSILGWFGEGARREDDTKSEAFARYRNHFFDPRPNAPNRGGFTGILIPGVLSGLPAPDWALEPTNIAAQIYSYRDARTYFLDALTKSTKAERDSSLALTFRALGQVIHVVQDMAQPQHTRNDLHAFPPSLYERYIDRADIRRNLNYAAGSIPSFARPRDFFVNDQGTGLAQYSNRSFITQGTNFRWDGRTAQPNATYEFPRPSPNLEIASVQNENVPDALKTYCGPNPGCFMQFYSSVNDRGEIQPRAATRSVFADDLDQYNVTLPDVGSDPRFSFNRLNFDKAHPNLIPRAVAYSAGMIDYFFRGKIDLAKDESQINGFFIQNLGAEPVKGRFALYYDDTQAVRKPVLDINGNSVVWMTAELLAENNGVLAAGGNIPVTLNFDPPTDAKTPDEYMLVFNGDMGEEKAESGGVGAVAAKLLRAAPYRGALYVSGLDAQGQLVTFKVDTRGLRVLNGRDEQGQIHSTPNTWSSPNQTDIDPLHSVVQTYGDTVLPRLSRVKQVIFQNAGLGGLSHQTVALSLRNRAGDMMAYVLDSATDRLTFWGSGMTWVARSADPAIGDFTFSPVVSNASGTSGTLRYRRRFRDANNNITQDGGSIPLPSFPTTSVGNLNTGTILYNGFNSGDVVVSPDGLTVSGFKDQTQPQPFSSFNNTYDLKITLGVQPLASIVHVESVPSRSETVVPNLNESTRSGPGNSSPDQHIERHTHTRLNNGELVQYGPRIFVDYIKNRLVTWTEAVLNKQHMEFIQDSKSDIVWNPKASCPFTITTDEQQFTQVVYKTTTTVTATLDQNVTFAAKNIPRDAPSNVLNNNYTRNFSSHQVDTYPCNGPGVLGTPVIKDNLVYDPEIPASNPSMTGFTVLRTLNGRVDGSILLNGSANAQLFQPNPTYSFRGKDFGFNVLGYVADASPLGEIFLVTPDKSVIIYDPGQSSGMPLTINLPSNIVKILAAIWM